MTGHEKMAGRLEASGYSSPSRDHCTSVVQTDTSDILGRGCALTGCSS